MLSLLCGDEWRSHPSPPAPRSTSEAGPGINNCQRVVNGEASKAKPCVSTFPFGGCWCLLLLFLAQPSRADNFNRHEPKGHGLDITFTLPRTLTPSSVGWNGVLAFQNVTGTSTAALRPLMASLRRELDKPRTALL